VQAALVSSLFFCARSCPASIVIVFIGHPYPNTNFRRRIQAAFRPYWARLEVKLVMAVANRLGADGGLSKAAPRHRRPKPDLHGVPDQIVSAARR